MFRFFLISCFVVALYQPPTIFAADKVVVVPLRGRSVTNPIAPVPKTGQTLCYESPASPPGAPIKCGGTGQDGELQKGVSSPVPRFTDNGNGTVTDNLTDLVWMKDANCYGGQATRANALAFAQAFHDGYGAGFPFVLLDCGLSDGSNAGDWRLPNRFELESLLDIGEVGPPLPASHPFINVMLDYYWTSSYDSYYAELGVGWAVHFSAGAVQSRSWDLEPSYVWLVRDK